MLGSTIALKWYTWSQPNKVVVKFYSGPVPFGWGILYNAYISTVSVHWLTILNFEFIRLKFLSPEWNTRLERIPGYSGRHEEAVIWHVTYWGWLQSDANVAKFGDGSVHNNITVIVYMEPSYSMYRCHCVVVGELQLWTVPTVVVIIEMRRATNVRERY